MDEVIADVMPNFLNQYEFKFGRRPDKEEYEGSKVFDIEGAGDLWDNLHQKGFFSDLPVMTDSQKVLIELHKRFDIYIVSAAMEFRNSFEDKYDWLQKHFPFIYWKNMVFCGKKEIIYADWLIDDHVKNLENFKGTGLLYTASHNVFERRFERVNNWKEIHQYFKDK